MASMASMEVSRDVYIKSLCEQVEWLTACTSEPDPEVVLVTPVEGNLFTGKG